MIRSKIRKRLANQLVTSFAWVHAVDADEVAEARLIQKITAHIHQRAIRFFCNVHNGVGVRFMEAVNALHISKPAKDLFRVVPLAS